MRLSIGRIVSGVVAGALMLPLCARAQSRHDALDRVNLDTTCAPCTDFYQFANGGWLARTKIPAAYPEFGSFQELYDRNEAVLHSILDSSAARVRQRRYKPGTPQWKVGVYYATCMDSAAIDREGAKPLRPDLDRIAAIRTTEDLKRALAELEKRTGIAPWSDGSTQDERDAANTIAGLSQGGLSLPNSEYYTKTDTVSQALREKARAHVERMFVLLGDAPAVAHNEAATVMAFETRLAKASRTPIQLRDPVANYHRMTLTQVDSLTPHFSWSAFYGSLGVSNVGRLDVGQPEFFAAIDTMFATVPIADWKTYLRWQLVHRSAFALSTPFVMEHFEAQRLFTGATEILPRWKRCVSLTDNDLGELLGQEYVAQAFTPAAKARAVQIVGNLVSALHSRIEKLEWMGPNTKKQALVKLDAFTRKIGYPDSWRDYSAMQLSSKGYFSNVRAARVWAEARDWAKIGKPTNRTEWVMTPPTVNAYYNPNLNEIVFPAGILQPPFYDPDADDAVNYGAMGAVIGHEMSHGFDDEGRQFDEAGNLRDWWTKEDAAKYDTEAQKIVRQFDAYTVLDTATHVQGKLTLGENIGDFGGLTVAYAAMENALAKNPQPVIDGFTPEQRFFLGWAQVWREVDRPEYSRLLINADPHSPAKWRVNGPFSNMPEFKAAWGCKDGDPMVRPADVRPQIW